MEDEGNKKGYLVKHNHALLWFMRKIQSQKISYQTSILRLKICLWEGNQKKIIKWKPKSVRDQSQKLANDLYLVKNSKEKT